MRANLPSFQPLEVTSRGSIVDALVERRRSLGWTIEEMDVRAGWADRLLGKLENPRAPSARNGFLFSWPSDVLPSGAIVATGMGDTWLQALGLRLVLVDAKTASEIGAEPAPEGPRRAPGCAARFHAQRRFKQGTAERMSAPAYEVADRALAAKTAFRVTVVEHPWLAERPDVRAKAEAVEAALDDLRRAVVTATT